MILFDECNTLYFVDSLNLNSEEKLKLQNTDAKFTCDECAGVFLNKKKKEFKQNNSKSKKIKHM